MAENASAASAGPGAAPVAEGDSGEQPEEPGAGTSGAGASGEARADTVERSADKDAAPAAEVPSDPRAALQQVPASVDSDEEEQSAGVRGPRPEPVAVSTAHAEGADGAVTPTAPPSPRTAGGRESGLPAQTDAAADTADDAVLAAAAPETAPGNASDRASNGSAAEDPAAPATRKAAPETGPSADRGPDGKDGKDGKDAASEQAGEERAALRRPVVKPLVSDLPAERPEGPEAGRQGAFGGPVAFGPPGTPTRADRGRKGSSKAADAPRSTAAPLPAAQPAATPSPAVGAATPTGPSTAGASAKDGAFVGESSDSEVPGPEGTRRMPVPDVPDKAPMTLLAELTNTPPPPQTAVRTVLRRVKIWTPLALLLVLVFAVVQAVRPLPAPSLRVTAASSYTFPGTALAQSMPWPTEGQSVAEVEGLGSLGVHGKQTPVPIASVTKVMTAYVVLRDHPLSGKEDGPTITVDAQAAQEATSEDQSTAPVQEGQKFTERQMLELLLVPSGNNIARLLARWDAGTQEAFVAKMTATAKTLGMSNTTYTGASGIEETTVSTAVDQLKLAREVMKNDVFRSVVALPNVDIPGVDRIYNNNNDLVNIGVVGIKTGSSTPAGGALMWAAHRTIDGKQQLILGVVLQQRGGKSTPAECLQVALDRSQALIDSVQKAMGSQTIVHKGDVVGLVDDGLGGSTPVVAGEDLKVIGWPGMQQRLTLTPSSGGVPHSAKAGTQVGSLSFGDGAARTAVPVTLQSDLRSPGFGAKLTRVS
ncbi:D-alanyl-D-alanine carboxypeptidase [Actinacidiphila yeochonensis]|uniref:D-alanyl-D-alanine carboxypeptidase n=1 Tax=Actinacidiphila yeochonensis TaxID=89050 RepID=UPI000691E520|nr:D-alanyl-D-alanine carboxypeptidase [Actinacidiphila yeochonensis]